MTSRVWHLEGFLGESKALRRFKLHEFPYRIGRQEGLSLTLDTAGVSRNHAEFVESQGQLVLVDLNSTNGTYLNRQRLVGQSRVHDGDIVHFADQEFRVVSQTLSDRSDLSTTRAGIGGLSERLPPGAREFQQLLLGARVKTAFQPIVYADGRIHAYEMLGRGDFEGLPESPGPLFKLAESVELEVHLSELFRKKGVDRAAELDPSARYFFNIHPREGENIPRLIKSLEALRLQQPRLDLVLEVHEAAVTEPETIRTLRDELNRLRIGFAYDDFGAGQARLVEITEVPPDYVKLDMGLVRDIDKASEAKRQMIGLFQDFLTRMNVQFLAEGVASEAEAQTLMNLGVKLYQGYWFGKPNLTLDRLR